MGIPTVLILLALLIVVLVLGRSAALQRRSWSARDTHGRRLRVSISTLVVCVLIAAVDLALLREFPGNDRIWLNLFALPMANILMFAFYLGHSYRRRGERSPFLLGFQLLGWPALLTYLVWCRMHPLETSMSLASASKWVHFITLNNLDFDTMKRLDPTFGLAQRISTVAQGAAVSAILTTIMLVVASCGGMIVRRWHRAARNSGTVA